MELSTKADSLERKLQGLAFIAAPALLGTSTFFWQEGGLGIIGGTICVYSFVLWIPTFLGLFGMLRGTMPRLSVLGALLGIFVSIGGSDFGMDGIYGGVLRTLFPDSPAISRVALHAAMGLPSVFVLFLPGILFPVTLIIVGIALARSKAVPLWVGLLLVLGAIAFPMSRIPRIEMIAHCSDFLLLIPMVWLGWRSLAGPQAGQS